MPNAIRYKPQTNHHIIKHEFTSERNAHLSRNFCKGNILCCKSAITKTVSRKALVTEGNMARTDFGRNQCALPWYNKQPMATANSLRQKCFSTD